MLNRERVIAHALMPFAFPALRQQVPGYNGTLYERAKTEKERLSCLGRVSRKLMPKDSVSEN